MDATVFLSELQNILQRDEPITQADTLDDLEEWDSLAIMACMAYFDKKFGLKTTYQTFQHLHSVADIIALTKGAVA